MSWRYVFFGGAGPAGTLEHDMGIDAAKSETGNAGEHGSGLVAVFGALKPDKRDGQSLKIPDAAFRNSHEAG